jgi:hypothetical protein
MNIEPKTENEAIELCLQLSAKFGFQVVFLQEHDLHGLIGTENWGKKDYENALELATEYVSDLVGEQISEAVDSINDR